MGYNKAIREKPCMKIQVIVNLSLPAMLLLHQIAQPVPFLGSHEHDHLKHELLSTLLLHFGVDAGKELL